MNFSVQLFWKLENHLFWCFLSQLQYRNENQNLISNFIFQFIKKTRNGTLGTRIQVDAITSSYGLSQLVCEPTHILPNLSSCIDLIFINQNKFTRNSGVHASLHPNFHHPIVYAKLNLKTEYPPPPPPIIWTVSLGLCKTNTQLLNRSIETFNWEKLFENKNVCEQLYLFNKTMLKPNLCVCVCVYGGGGWVILPSVVGFPLLT